METLSNMKKLYAAVQKYRYAILVLILGLVLMMLPTERSRETVPESPAEAVLTAEEQDLEKRLEVLLSQIHGAGIVKVLLTERNGTETFFQSNEQIDEDGTAVSKNSSVVITEDQDHAETALVRRIDPPVYQGAVVLCQGADDNRVRLSIVEAIRCATGLGADQITVIKMK